MLVLQTLPMVMVRVAVALTIVGIGTGIGNSRCLARNVSGGCQVSSSFCPCKFSTPEKSCNFLYTGLSHNNRFTTDKGVF